jgi:glycosyltransferase involved in cell wall biosynthesis
LKGEIIVALSDRIQTQSPKNKAPSGALRKRVLLVSHYHPELIRGGGQQCCYELFQGLKAEADIQPFFLAGTDDSYPALYKLGACITGFDGRENEFLYLSADYDRLWHRTTSPRHIAAYTDLLQTLRPDVVHFQHFMLLGIDMLSLTRTVLPQCRIVFTLHEYLTMCDARGHMVRLTDGSLCSEPSPVRCHQCLPHHSPDHFVMRKMWFLRHLSVVDRYACACHFQVAHHVDWGLDRSKIFVVPNGEGNKAKTVPAPLEGPKNRFGFFGQFVDAKGVHIILRAVDILRAEGFTDFKVELNGDNIRFATAPIRQEIESFLAAESQRPVPEQIVSNNGAYHVDQIESRMLRIDWSLVPSIWWETFGLVISEAWMFKRPVICSNVGGMAERIQHDINGLHFQIADPRSLAAAMRRAATEPGLWQKLSSAAPQAPSRADVVKGYRALYED